MSLYRLSRLPLATSFFNATTSTINLGANPAQDCLAQSCMAYVYPDATGENSSGYIMALTSSATSNGPRLIHLHNSGNTQFGFQGNTTGVAGGPAHNTTAGTGAYGKWHHVAASWDGSINSSGIIVYVGTDGAKLSQQTVNGANNAEGSGAGSITAGRNLHIGNREGTDRTWNGSIAWVARWNRVLSLAEFQHAQLYGPLAVPLGLILCWANDTDLGPYKMRPTKTAITRGRSPIGISNFFLPGSAFMPPAPAAGIVSTNISGRLKLHSSSTATHEAAAAGVAISGRVGLLRGSLQANHVADGAVISGRVGLMRGATNSKRLLTIDGASALTTIDPSLTTYRVHSDGTYEITVTPRLTYAGNNSDTADKFGWRTACFKVSGVQGAKLKVVMNRYESDTAGTASSFVKAPWASTDHGYFSADKLTWTHMDTASSKDPTTTNTVTISHSAAMTDDAIWISKYPRVGTDEALAWIQSLAATYPTMIGDVAGGSSYVAATYSAQTDELGRTIPACPLLAFMVSDASLAPVSGQKKLAMFFSGVHATEDGGNLAMQRAVEFFCSSDAKAISLRRGFDLIVFPIINAPGRNGGHYRTQFQSTAVGGATAGPDINHHYEDASPDFEVVSLSRAAAVVAMNGRKLDWFMDWHTKYDGAQGAYTYGYGSSRLMSFADDYTTIGLDGSNIADTTYAYFRNTHKTLASITPENSQQDGNGTPSQLQTWGEAWMKGASDWFAAGGFSVDPRARLAIRGSTTASKITSFSPAWANASNAAALQPGAVTA